MSLRLPDQTLIADMVARALAEDVGSGDIHAQLIDPRSMANARVITREFVCLAGCAWVAEVFRQLDPRIMIHWYFSDGECSEAGQVLCQLHGPAQALLTGERTALNFLQLLSGTASTTREYVRALASCQTAQHRVRLLDTRKTIPGWRLAQKYAVRCGGGENHRIGLFDAFLLKDNHLMALGGVANAIARCRALAPGKNIEVEVSNLVQLAEAITHGADSVMLDNFDEQQLALAVQRAKGKIRVEVSGNIDLGRLAALAQLGIDDISVGVLTKHVRAIDLSLQFF